ncbi:MAG: ABC transporter C-terminal domain-containing protein, partial [Thermomicrobium sp.]
TIWAIEGDELVVSLGNFTDYQRRHTAERPEPPRGTTLERGPSAPPRTVTRRSPRQVERELAQVEHLIEELEERAQQLAEDLDEATARQDVEAITELGTAYETVMRELEQAYARWEMLQEELAGLQVGG